MTALDDLLMRLDSAAVFLSHLEEGAVLVHRGGVLITAGCTGRLGGCCARDFSFEEFLESIKEALGNPPLPADWRERELPEAGREVTIVCPLCHVDCAAPLTEVEALREVERLVRLWVDPAEGIGLQEALAEVDAARERGR